MCVFIINRVSLKFKIKKIVYSTVILSFVERYFCHGFLYISIDFLNLILKSKWN